jgi:hypothetical protein
MTILDKILHLYSHVVWGSGIKLKKRVRRPTILLASQRGYYMVFENTVKDPYP